jgi:hypothetical protein
MLKTQSLPKVDLGVRAHPRAASGLHPPARTGPLLLAQHTGSPAAAVHLHRLEPLLLILQPLLCLKQLAPVDLLVGIGSDELLDDHVAATDANHELAIHDLGKDLSRTEHVEAVAHALDGDLALHQVHVLGEVFVHGVALGGGVSGNASCGGPRKS